MGQKRPLDGPTTATDTEYISFICKSILIYWLPLGCRFSTNITKKKSPALAWADVWLPCFSPLPRSLSLSWLRWCIGLLKPSVPLQCHVVWLLSLQDDSLTGGHSYRTCPADVLLSFLPGTFFCTAVGCPCAPCLNIPALRLFFSREKNPPKPWCTSYSVAPGLTQTLCPNLMTTKPLIMSVVFKELRVQILVSIMV